MDEPEDFQISPAIPASLQKSPVALYVTLLSLMPPDWTVEDLTDLYYAIMAEYDVPAVNPLSVVSLDNAKH